MDQTQLDKKYMKMAITLAKQGFGRVHPNPLVGCVIVKDKIVVGKGYHAYFGGAHAEINALGQAGKESNGATMYVTLEPCVHYGKTPPCVKAIIKAGLKRVVIGIVDPNHQVSSRGIRQLKANAIQVKVGILGKEIRELNKTYIESIRHPKSHIILKMAMTLDGKIATKTGDSKWISSPQTREFVHKLRSRMDGILVGVGTVIADNPELSSHGQGKNPVRIILDPNLRLPLNSKVLDGRIPSIIIYNSNKVKVKHEQIARKEGVNAVFLPEKHNQQIDFKHIVKKLSKMSINKILIEGGGETAALALGAGIVDEVIFEIAPKIIGGRSAKTPVEGSGIDRMAKAIDIKNAKVVRIGKDFVITGKVK